MTYNVEVAQLRVGLLYSHMLDKYRTTPTLKEQMDTVHTRNTEKERLPVLCCVLLLGFNNSRFYVYELRFLFGF